MTTIAKLRIAALVALALGGCSPKRAQPAFATASAEPCRGSSFDFDAPPRECVVPMTGQPAVPPRESLEVRTDPSPATIPSGASGRILLEMRNVSGRPLPLDLDDSCLAFEATAESSVASSFESECGGLCSAGKGRLHIVLDPGGVLRKQIALDAVVRKITGDECKERVVGPLPAGRYELKIVLPWTDPAPIPSDPQAKASRMFTGPLNVVAVR